MANQKVVFARGKKVILRPLRKETDLEPCVRWFNDPKVTQYLTFYLPLTRHEESEWFDNLGKRDDELVFAIGTLKGEFIGTVGFHEIHPSDRTATCGIVIGEKGRRGANWERGFGTDAMMLLLNYGFNTLNLRKINALVFAPNRRSLRCCLKCGYEIEGRRRLQRYRNGVYHDELVLAVFKENWLPIWERYHLTSGVK